MFRVGSEVEGGFRYSRFGDYNQLAEMMNAEGFKCSVENRDYESEWSIHYEGLDDIPYGFFAQEVATRIMPLSEYFSTMRNYFDFLGDDFVTSSGCGFHHGVSYVNPTKNRLLQRRQLLLAHLWVSKLEEPELRKWGRLGNQYTRPLNLDRHLKAAHVNPNLLPGHLGHCVAACFEKMLPRGTNPYLEVRVMGNDNYEKRLDDVATSLEKVFEIMEETINASPATQDEFVQYVNKHASKDSIAGIISHMAFDVKVA